MNISTNLISHEPITATTFVRFDGEREIHAELGGRASLYLTPAEAAELAAALTAAATHSPVPRVMELVTQGATLLEVSPGRLEVWLPGATAPSVTVDADTDFGRVARRLVPQAHAA